MSTSQVRETAVSERSIFLSALEISEEAARQSYLDEACRENPLLRQEIESLLKSYAQAGTFLESPATGLPTVADARVCGGEEDDQAVLTSAALASLRPFLQPATKPGCLGKLGHYELESVLGQGSFGIVLKAFDEKLHRLVAIKVMPPALAATSAPRKRFLREARSAAAIRHENIVAIHAVEEQPLPYLVMEYVPGVTLQEWLDQHGPLDVTDVLRIGQQIAAGLAAAHAHGLIHRDIKPANILLESGIEPRAKITDFGLARTADDASLTQSGIIAGTPLYMSPEQARGLALDPRSDLFSLGSVLYTMICGRPPFRAPNTIAVLKRLCEETPRSIMEVIPEVPAWLCQLIARLHAKEPADRFASAREVAELLGQYLAYRQEPERVAAPILQSEPVTGTPVFEIVPELVWPGRGLIATGCLNLFGLLAVLPEVITVLRLRAAWATFDVTPLALPLLIGVPAVIVLLGGLKLQRAESFGWCVVASLLAVVSFPGALIGFPAGLWALYVLTRPEIRAKFQSTAPRRKSREWPFSLSIGLLVALLIFWYQRGAYPDRLVNGSIALACACVMLVCWVVERWLLQARAERAAQVVASILTAAALLSAGNAWLAWETPDPTFHQQRELARHLQETGSSSATHTVPVTEAFLNRLVPSPLPGMEQKPLLLPLIPAEHSQDSPAEALSPENVKQGILVTPILE